jgi:hypothetical protein
MKKMVVFLLVSCCVLLSFSCVSDEMDPDYATVTIYNQSDFDVTELYAYQEEDVTKKKKGEERTFTIKWAPGGPCPYSVQYRANGNRFDVEQMEGVLSYNRMEFIEILRGEGVGVYYTNDPVSLEKELEREGKKPVKTLFLITDDPVAAEEEDKKDVYYSPWNLTDGADIRVYIKNEGYEVTGGLYSVRTIDDIFPMVSH